MATITFNVDENLKKEAVDLFNRMGLDMSSALRLFMTQSVNLRRIPFEITVPNEEVEKAKKRIQEIALSDAKFISLKTPEGITDMFDEAY